ncbi:hypothetical protein RUM44_011206 [Polyplax serrata]|uniref:Uncharacterized protein n=1 Tax=Polyplax serrata TaxID=468196 RepID=A0ABR1AQ12_POLSC
MVATTHKYLFSGIYVFITLTSSSQCFCVGENENTFFQEGQLTLKTIHRALTYFRENPKSVFDDVKLGVLLAKSNLQWITDRIPSRFGNDHVLRRKLDETMELCTEILEMNQIRNSPLLNNEFWLTGPESITYGGLGEQEDDFTPPDLDSCQSMEDYMNKGTPNMSDFCLNELFKLDCNVSNYCWFSEIGEGIHSGYGTTHRLLYLLAVSKLKCVEKRRGGFHYIGERKKDLCRQILSEANGLFKRSYLLEVRDLFLEQIALCGYEGFSEFGVEPWRRAIRTWQDEKGCFQNHGLPADCSTDDVLPSPVKRTDFVVGGCHTHLTATAVAALSFHLRLILNSVVSTR